MGKSLSQEILEHLIVCGSQLMVSAFFGPRGLGSSLREAEEIASRCTHDFSKHSRDTVSVALSRMKSKKLVSVNGPKKKAIWRITQRGKNHFKSLKDETELPPEDGKTRVIMFDIPEDRRVDRNWLRAELLSCDYTLLQKSVFMGLRPLPAKLLEKLRDKKLISYVHVVGLETE